MGWEIHTIKYLYDGSCAAGLPDGTYVKAVPEPYTAGSLKAAWAVLTGKAFAFRWPKPGELEEALAPARIIWPRSVCLAGQAGSRSNLADANSKETLP